MIPKIKPLFWLTFFTTYLINLKSISLSLYFRFLYNNSLKIKWKIVRTTWNNSNINCFNAQMNMSASEDKDLKYLSLFL